MEIKANLSDKIAALIKKDITSGKFAAGALIPAEPELMKLYSVGRSTVREAIKSLAIAGILQVQQGRGTTVSQQLPDETIDSKIRRSDFEEVNAVRSLLDREIVLLAVANRTTEHLKHMELYLEQRREAIAQEQRQACVDADIAFHTAIADASGNSVLAGLYQSFTDIIRKFFAKRDERGLTFFAMSHHLHVELYKAIKDQKSNKAQTIMQQILNNNY